MMRSVPVVGAPQPWPPPPPPSPSSSSVNATDNKTFQNLCTTPGICSTDCPQWCGYLVLPPPPPLFIDSSDDDESSSSRISPLMAALIAVLAAAFLLLFYYTVVSRICRRRNQRRRRHFTTQILNNPNSSFDDPEIRIDPMVHDPARLVGLDESFIRQITVFKYRLADGLIEGTDCAVCLSEFKEDESLRLMPNCEHAFHIPCIDTWLKSNSSCPLCRATMNPQPVRPSPNTNPNPNPNPSPNGAVSVAAAMRVQSRNDDVVLVVREVDRGEGDQVIVCHEERERGEEDGGGCVGSEERESGEEQVRKGSTNRR